MQMGNKYIRNRYNNKMNWSHILYQLTGCVPIHRYEYMERAIRN